MTPAFRPVATLGLALLLAACGSGNDAGKDSASAGGEVLEGSTSDAMLPLDTVRSQAPLAPRSGEGAQTKSDAATEAGASDAAQGESAPTASAPAPAATPSAE